MRYLPLALLAMLLAGGAYLYGKRSAESQALIAHSRLAYQLDSAVAEIQSAQSLAAMVPALKDSLRAYKGKPEAAVRIVVRRDTVHIVDTLPTDTTGAIDSLVFPPRAEHGVTVRERLDFSPRIPPTVVTRTLGIAIDPDTISLALLRQPDGLARFIASAEREGIQVKVIDAGEIERKRVTFGFGCAAGPSLNVTIGGSAYGGIGLTCGVVFRP